MLKNKYTYLIAFLLSLLLAVGSFLYKYDKNPTSYPQKIKNQELYLKTEFWRDIKPENLKNQLNKIQNINMTTQDQKSFLHLAILHGQYPKLVSILISAGVDHKLVDENRKKAIHYAVLRENKDWAQEILKYDKDLNTPFEETPLPLHFAIFNRQPASMIQFLLDKGADPHLLTRRGNTSLILAVIPNRVRNISFIDPEVVQTLLSYEVNINTKSFEGKTAFEYMKENEAFMKTQIFKDISKQIN